MANNDDINSAPIKAVPIPADASIQKFQVRAAPLKPNPRWRTRYVNKLFTVGAKPILSDQDTVFTMGSCFAERIRIALKDQSIIVGPHLASIPLRPKDYEIDELPKGREHMNYYNTFTIRQEFERHLGLWKQDDDDYWTVPFAKEPAHRSKQPGWSGDVFYQDPYRRRVFARTPETLRQAVSHIDEAMDASIRKADVFFFTLGLTEVFRNRHSGKIACQIPAYAAGGGEKETEFHRSTLTENLDNVSAIVGMIKKINPNARIVVTVSPVRMSRTFTDYDVAVANTEMKSILRVVAGEIDRMYENVTYFPTSWSWRTIRRASATTMGYTSPTGSCTGS